MAVPSGAVAGAARAIVRRHLDPSVAAVEVVGEGEWSRCFAFRSGDRDLVVRIGSQRVDFEKDHLAAAWAGPDLPVPAVLARGDDPAGSWCISTRAGGVPLESLAPPAGSGSCPPCSGCSTPWPRSTAARHPPGP